MIYQTFPWLFQRNDAFIYKYKLTFIAKTLPGLNCSSITLFFYVILLVLENPGLIRGIVISPGHLFKHYHNVFLSVNFIYTYIQVVNYVWIFFYQNREVALCLLTQWFILPRGSPRCLCFTLFFLLCTQWKCIFSSLNLSKDQLETKSK